jgi:hypothetical protein
VVEVSQDTLQMLDRVRRRLGRRSHDVEGKPRASDERRELGPGGGDCEDVRPGPFDPHRRIVAQAGRVFRLPREDPLGGLDLYVTHATNGHKFTQLERQHLKLGADLHRAQIRTSMRFVTYQDRKRVAADLRPVYRAVNADAAEAALAAFDEKWGQTYR